MPYDVVIRGGEVIDGTGGQRVRADVAVQDGVIVEVGTVTERARREIDAEAHIVTPGFIDGHTHMDAQVFWDPLGTSSCWHGITTVVMGNCGFTLAPVRPSQPELVVRNLERAEDISGAAMAEGITWSWEHFAEYLDTLDRLPKGINYAAYIGHSAVRTWAMGERAFDQEANEDDLRAMEGEVRAAMEAGAVGFTTSRSSSHATSDDRPVASRIATWDEVVRLVSVMSELGRGIFELAPEDAARATGTTEQADALARMEKLALGSRRPMTFGIAPVPWYQDWFDLLDRTAAAGGRMFGQTHSRGNTLIMSFKSQIPFENVPGWKELRALPLAEQRVLLSDPAVRARLVEATEHAEYKRPVGPEIRKPNYDTLRVWYNPTPPNPLLADLARVRGVHPVELMILLALETDFEQLFTQTSGAVGAPTDAATLEALMRHPNTVMTFSDAGAHVSQICDCSLQTHLLAHWVRERQAFTLEESVQMLTSTPARLWGFDRRGLLRAGAVADINVFDAARVGPRLPTIETDLPGGAKRLLQRADGFLATLVAGQVVLENGVHTGALPGRLLRAGR